MALLPYSDWLVEHLRFTAFPVLGTEIQSPTWWEAVAGEMPDQTTSNPRRGSSEMSGTLEKGKLALRLEPTRIDWILVPPDADVISLEPKFPSLGPAPEVIEFFGTLMDRWLALADVPESTRFAFGAVLRHDEESKRAGYQRLPEYIPVDVNPDSSDLLYQINNPAPSATGIDGLTINRLSKWSVSLFKFVAETTASQRFETPEMFAVRLELDINTGPTYPAPLPRARFGDIYRDLAAAAEVIASQGVRSL